MLFLKSHLRKFWRFHVFFCLFIGVGFLFFAEKIFAQPIDDLIHFSVGVLMAFPIAFLISWIYEMNADGTFHRVWGLYLAEAIVISLCPVPPPDSAILKSFGIIIYPAAYLTPILALAFIGWKLRESSAVFTFHFIGLILWIVFMGYYSVNPHLYFHPHW